MIHARATVPKCRIPLAGIGMIMLEVNELGDCATEIVLGRATGSKYGDMRLRRAQRPARKGTKVSLYA